MELWGKGAQQLFRVSSSSSLSDEFLRFPWDPDCDLAKI